MNPCSQTGANAEAMVSFQDWLLRLYTFSFCETKCMTYPQLLYLGIPFFTARTAFAFLKTERGKSGILFVCMVVTGGELLEASRISFCLFKKTQTQLLL